MSDTLLALVQNCSHEVDTLADLVGPHPEREVELTMETSFSHRRLGIATLLLWDDRDAFRHHLRCAAQTWLHAVRIHHAGKPCPARFWCGSTWQHISSALAAGVDNLAAQLARTCPTTANPDVEYVEDHCYHHVLSRLVLQDQALEKILAICDLWESVLDGVPPGALAACRALTQRDAKTFRTGFAEALASRKDAVKEWRTEIPADQDLLATEGRIHIDGLALLALARRFGLLDRPKAGAGCPLIAQFTDAPPPLADDAWTRSEP